MTSGRLPCTLVGLWLYPVKSLAGVAVQQARLHAGGGLEGDREWALVNAQDEVTWQGAVPRLALVRPTLSPETLTLHAPGTSPLSVSLGARRTGRTVQIWNDGQKRNEAFWAEDAGEEARGWLTALLGQPLRLVRLGPEARRREGLQPLHVLSRGSLAALNGELRQSGKPEAEIERFRPNLLLGTSEDTPAPFLEERATALVWSGGVRVRLEQPCVRCVMPNIDLRTAHVGREPLATLVRMSAQRHPGTPVRFGVYGRGERDGVLERGQQGWAELSPSDEALAQA